MEKRYSAKSIQLERFLPLFGALNATINPDSVKIYKALFEVSSDIKPEDSLRTLKENEFPLKIIFFKDSASISFNFSIFWSLFEVDINGDDIAKTEMLHELVKDSLHLAEPSDEDYREIASLPNINALLWRVYDIIEELSKKFEEIKKKPISKLRCFVSFRFDDHSKALALELREFLELVGVEFSSGLGFEPRSITAKVLERLGGTLDLFVVIQTTSGSSAWLNQEIGFARARELPILVLKEEGSEAEPGILADTEYIPFEKDNICKAFVGILQALYYLKNRKNGV